MVSIIFLSLVISVAPVIGPMLMVFWFDTGTPTDPAPATMFWLFENAFATRNSLFP